MENLSKKVKKLFATRRGRDRTDETQGRNLEMDRELGGEVYEISRANRFPHEGVGLAPAGGPDRRVVVRPRKDDDDKCFARILGAYVGQDVQPVHVFEGDIEEHDGGKRKSMAISISAFAGEIRDGLGAGFNPMDGVGQAGFCDGVLEKESVGSGVLDEEK